MHYETRPIKKIITKEEYDRAVGALVDNDLSSMLQRAFSGYHRTLNMEKSPVGIFNQSDWLYESEHAEDDYYYWKEDGYETVCICSEREYKQLNNIL